MFSMCHLLLFPVFLKEAILDLFSFWFTFKTWLAAPQMLNSHFTQITWKSAMQSQHLKTALCSVLQRALEGVAQWGQLNDLKLNAAKCQAMTFIRRRTTINHNYINNGINLQRVTTVKDLEVFLDAKLDFIFHIDRTIAKCRSILVLSEWKRRCKTAFNDWLDSTDDNLDLAKKVTRVKGDVPGESINCKFEYLKSRLFSFMSWPMTCRIECCWSKKSLCYPRRLWTVCSSETGIEARIMGRLSIPALYKWRSRSHGFSLTAWNAKVSFPSLQMSEVFCKNFNLSIYLYILLLAP